MFLVLSCFYVFVVTFNIYSEWFKFALRLSDNPPFALSFPFSYQSLGFIWRFKSWNKRKGMIWKSKGHFESRFIYSLRCGSFSKNTSKINTCVVLVRITIGNKAKGRITKRVFQENKGGEFFGKFGVLCFLETPRFKIRPFALLPTNCYCFWKSNNFLTTLIVGSRNMTEISKILDKRQGSFSPNTDKFLRLFIVF